jgi:hypothetical protein
MEQFALIKKVFESCSTICINSKTDYIGSFDFTTVPFVRSKPSLFVAAASRFIQNFSQNFLLVHSDQDQKIKQQKNKKGAWQSTSAKEKARQEELLLKEYDKLLCTVFSNLCREITALVKSVGDQISKVVSSKEQDFFTEEMAKQYSNYSQQLDVFFRSGIASTFLLYVQTLPELCRVDPYLISSISNSCLDVL